jgi:hypothetical protein
VPIVRFVQIPHEFGLMQSQLPVGRESFFRPVFFFGVFQYIYSPPLIRSDEMTEASFADRLKQTELPMLVEIWVP